MKILRPLEKIYHIGSGLKNRLYDSKIIKAVELGVPVVSVGNISFGGVGKTPCIILLANELSKYYRINIITKSYKATLQTPRLVDLSLDNAAAVFGDEACLISTKVKNSRVWSGPDKSATAQASLVDQPTLFLLDDGFSHRKLARNFDLVLIDATCGLDDLLRESKRNLNRASAVLVTKVNLVGSHSLSAIKQSVTEIAPHLEKLIYTSTVKTELQVDIKLPLFVFSGLGRPQSLIQDLQKQGYKIQNQMHFADHHSYTIEDQEKILTAFLNLKKQQPDLELVTTEKDFIKIFNPELKSLIQLTHHKIEISKEQKEVLIEKIRQSF
jgi:tetraacyldisaccharide 4'-kinase